MIEYKYKENMMTIRVQESEGQLLENNDYRVGVTECPSCGYDSMYVEGVNVWHQDIQYVILNPVSRWNPEYLIVISKCPKCFTPSWQHQSLLMFMRDSEDSKLPKRVVNRVNQEYMRRLRVEAERFVNSKCFSCSKLKDISTSCMYYRCNCKGRSGGPSSDCKSYRKLKR